MNLTKLVGGIGLLIALLHYFEKTITIKSFKISELLSITQLDSTLNSQSVNIFVSQSPQV